MKQLPRPKPCKVPGCGKLTYRGLCLECERRRRRELSEQKRARQLRFSGGTA